MQHHPTYDMMSLYRSDRYNLGRYDRRGRAEGGMYFDELDISPRAHLRSVMDARATRIMRPAIFDEDIQHYQPHQRYDNGRSRGGNKVPFGTAMKKLHKQITQAEEFYGELQTKYDTDIQGIKEYATPKILDALWVLKVNGRGQSGDGQEGFPEKGSEKLVAMQKKIKQALENAIDSNIDELIRQSKWSNSKIDSAKRLQKKVETANDQILDLLCKVTHAREYCEGLLSELNLLNTLVHPDDEKNQRLYRGTWDEEEEENNGNNGKSSFSNVHKCQSLELSLIKPADEEYQESYQGAWGDKNQEGMEQVEENERKENQVKGSNLQKESSANKDESIFPLFPPATSNGWSADPSVQW